MQNLIQKYGYASVFLLLFLLIVWGVVGIATYEYIKHHVADTNFSLTASLTPLIAVSSLTLAAITIRYNILSNKEKNALEFVKNFKDENIEKALSKLYALRTANLLSGKNQLDRKKINPIMIGLADLSKECVSKILNDKDRKSAERELKKLRSSNKIDAKKIDSIESKLKTSEDVSSRLEMRSHLNKILNVMESCANGVRYGIYDEGFIYNAYGSQFIEIYEMAYSYIKRRQNHSDRLFISAEWLAIKWTLQRYISGETSDHSAKLQKAIMHANHGLKIHLSAPDKKNLIPLLKKVNRLKFPE